MSLTAAESNIIHWWHLERSSDTTAKENKWRHIQILKLRSVDDVTRHDISSLFTEHCTVFLVASPSFKSPNFLKLELLQARQVLKSNELRELLEQDSFSLFSISLMQPMTPHFSGATLSSIYNLLLIYLLIYCYQHFLLSIPHHNFNGHFPEHAAAALDIASPSGHRFIT